MRIFALCALAALAAHGWSTISRLGFYHDDWSLFAQLEYGRLDGGSSLKSLLASYPNLVYRPLDAALWWAEHAAFGLRPLGWHLAAALLLAAVAAGAAGLLRRRGASPRTSALAALLFIAWPNKDAAVLWPAMSLAMCAALFWLASEHARLSFEEKGGAGLAALALAAFLASLGFYEQCLFLPLAWLCDPPTNKKAGNRRRALAFAFIGAVLLWLAARALLPRLGLASYPRSAALSPLHALVVAASAFRAHGPELIPAVLRDLRLEAFASPLGALAAFVLPASVLLLPEEREANRPPSPVYGLAVFVLAYLPFAFTADYRPVPLGPENRHNFIPALGLAFAAAAWWRRAPRPAWGAALAAAGFLLAASAGAARSWAEASRRQEVVLAAIAAKAAEWPPERELILRLPEILVGNRAPVFASHDSLSYAIRLRLGERERRADVLMPRARMTSAGLVRGERTTPYADLLLYDAATGSMFLPEAPKR